MRLKKLVIFVLALAILYVCMVVQIKLRFVVLM